VARRIVNVPFDQKKKKKVFRPWQRTTECGGEIGAAKRSIPQQVTLRNGKNNANSPGIDDAKQTAVRGNGALDCACDNDNNNNKKKLPEA
jgi:hypothetical protein